MLRRIVSFVGALAFGLFGLTTATGQGSPNVWQLKQIIVTSKANRYVTVVADSHDASGGHVRIAVDGHALDLCSGGQEQMQFDWQFTRDIRQLSDGDVIPAQLNAGIASLSNPCNGSIAGVSDITLRQSAGVTWPLTPDLQSQADSDRFVAATPAPGIAWVRANDGPHVRQAAVAIIRGPAKPNGNLAYFFIAIGLRGGGELWWTYLYERVGDGPQPPLPPGPVSGLTSEPGVDRRGGDYANFDVPGSDPGVCAADCAKDAQCLAYTYVRPYNGASAHCWLKNSIPPATPSNCCVSGIRAQPPQPGHGLTLETGIDRRGSDYTNFDVAADPNICRNDCASDGRCMAYTWVRPGVQGPSARCWLKSAIPPPTQADCCVSGARQ